MLCSGMASRLRSRLLLAIAVVAIAFCTNTVAHTTTPKPTSCGLATSEVWKAAGPGLEAVDVLVATASPPERVIGCWIGSPYASPNGPQEPSDRSSLTPRAPPFSTTPRVA